MPKKNYLTKIIAMLLAVMTCASFMILPASAATSGGDNTRTITVQHRRIGHAPEQNPLP